MELLRSPDPPKKRYTMADKRHALQRVADGEKRSRVCASLNIKKETLRDWVRDQDKIFAFTGSAKKTTMGGKGAHQSCRLSGVSSLICATFAEKKR